jgi:hypothetical protein
MVVMVLAVALLIGAGAWSVVLVVVVALCKSAKAGDRALDDLSGEEDARGPAVLSAPADRPSIGSLLGIDLSTHRRPTRAPMRAGAETAAPPLAPGKERGQMIGIAQAAKALGVEPEVLVAWEARYGYPACGLSASGRELSYAQLEISALAVALRAGLSVAAAIAAARATTGQDNAAGSDPWYRRHLPA